MSGNHEHPNADRSNGDAQGRHVFTWNGQRCFDWVEPADFFRSLIHQAKPDQPRPSFIIIEYCPPQRSSSNCLSSDAIAAVNDRLTAIEQLLERAVVPLAEDNRVLRNNELDIHVVRPVVDLLIQVLSRLDDELKDGAEGGVFGALRDARRADREEFRALLSFFGVSARYPKCGDRFSPAIHKVIARYPAETGSAVGRLRRVIRPAYVRDRDGQIIQKAWVEVSVSA